MSVKIRTISEDLILVQDERWRCGLGMQVDRSVLRTERAEGRGTNAD